MAAYSVHHDEANYDFPYVYDAFRFSRSRENAVTSSRGDTINMAMVLQHTKNLALSSTSETFMAFGHGRHAWLVSFSLLLFCSYVTRCFSFTLPLFASSLLCPFRRLGET